MAQLARQVAVHVRKGQVDAGDVAVVATGGFKAETAMVNLVGALVGVPVHYIHERFRKIITIEPLPISLDMTLLREGPGKAMFNGALVKDGTVERARIESLLRSDPRLELFIETIEVDGMELVAFNAVGEVARLLVEAPFPDWPPVSTRTPAQKIDVEPDHHRPAGWETFVDRLARNPYVATIRYRSAAPPAKPLIDAAGDSETELVARYSDGEGSIWLKLTTTAADARQRQLILPSIRRSARLA